MTGWWLERFGAKVAVGERHPRTLEAHRYHVDHHLLPAFAARRITSITVADVAALRREQRSPKTSAGALATLHSIVRYARRNDWIAVDPVFCGPMCRSTLPSGIGAAAGRSLTRCPRR